MQPSGPSWVRRFPTSDRVADLREPFRSRVIKFLDVLAGARARVQITATLRPPQRAYLMHYAWCIARSWQGTSPAHIPPFHPHHSHPFPVDIQWFHHRRDGQPDLLASKNAAQQMVHGFGIAHLGVPPALNSLHVHGEAIDMLISWDGTLAVKDANGRLVEIKSTPRDGTNADLISVGATYGVIHLTHARHDPPHWSINGR